MARLCHKLGESIVPCLYFGLFLVAYALSLSALALVGAMAPVTVFGPVISPNVARVVVCLEEVGVEYEVVNVDFAAGEHKSPDHLQRNPFGQLPAFQDGELMLFESRAISRHVLRKYKSTEVNLLREGNLEEAALVDVWVDVEAHQYDAAIAPIVYQHILVPMQGGTPDQELVDGAMEKLKKVLGVYEARLSKSKYLAGDFVSLADLSHVPYTVYFVQATPCGSVLDAYPKVKAWWEDLMSRPAVQRNFLIQICGRETLLKSTLSSQPIYHLTAFPEQKYLPKQIDRLQRNFLWKGDESESNSKGAGLPGGGRRRVRGRRHRLPCLGTQGPRPPRQKLQFLDCKSCIADSNLLLSLVAANNAHLSHAFQPFGQVPAFQDGDLMLFRKVFFVHPFHTPPERLRLFQTLSMTLYIYKFSTESRAICRYVLRKYKTPDGSSSNILRDGDLEGSALVDAWLDVEALQYEPCVHAVFVQHRVVPALGGTPDERAIVETLSKLRKVLEVYEVRLAEHRYLAGGDAVSLADLSHFPYTHYFMGMPYAAVFDSFPRVKAWWEDLPARPAVRKPFGQIPAFQDGDVVLFESRAICKYVLRKYKSAEADLLRDGGGDLKDAAMVDVWTEVEAHTYHPAISPIVYECFVIPTNEKVVEEALQKLKKVLDVYEARLADREYLAGDFFSFADVNHIPYTFAFMATPHAALFDAYPNVKAWWERLMARSVFGPAMSTNVARVLVCLEEVGADYEVVNMDFQAKEHKRPKHLARNPFGQIPAFQDGDLVLFESRAICKYVLRKYKSAEADLLREGGGDLKDAAMVDVWTEVEAHTYYPAISPIVYEYLVNPTMLGIPTNEKVVEESLEKLKKVLDVYEARLAGREYLAGDFFSFADINHFPYTFAFTLTPHALLFDSYPNVKAWWERLMARPSMIKLGADMAAALKA
ncbi:LOW QUALITY PROTEIN: hypothetical protein U9M48_026949 [Paspalum notatum var. saurae]|uniref:glutathione transferase n=1 Tax=Paspalum notatum var. saurae TaxID=547442 RepID=A0AAQ3TRY0_PASNO